jgi:hypothetical protein
LLKTRHRLIWIRRQIRRRRRPIVSLSRCGWRVP